jgi:hypothetical protein
MAMAAEGGDAVDHFLLFLITSSALFGVVGLIGYGFSNVARHGIRQLSTRVVLRSLAAFAAAAAGAAYLLGALYIVGAVLEAAEGGTDSAPIRPCRTPGWQDRDASIVGYGVDYLPIRFVCKTNDGGSYAIGPGYINPAMLGLSLTAVVLAVSATLAPEHRVAQFRLPS